MQKIKTLIKLFIIREKIFIIINLLMGDFFNLQLFSIFREFVLSN